MQIKRTLYKAQGGLLFLSMSIFIYRLMKLGYSRPLTEDDLFILGTSEQTKNIVPAFEAHWDSERRKLEVKTIRYCPHFH